MRKTRNERKRRRTVLGAFLLLLLTLLAFLAALLIFGTASAQETAGEAPVSSGDRIEEEEVMANAAIASACASEAKVVVGYDWDYVCRVVMQEAGSNSEELQLAVCQAIQNRCRATLLNPEEVCRMCYTFPHDGEVSESVRRACERIFLLGEVYEPVGSADMLYNPAINGPSEDHEGQKYICTIENVRFFEEIGGYENGNS